MAERVDLLDAARRCMQWSAQLFKTNFWHGVQLGTIVSELLDGDTTCLTGAVCSSHASQLLLEAWKRIGRLGCDYVVVYRLSVVAAELWNKLRGAQGGIVEFKGWSEWSMDGLFDVPEIDKGGGVLAAMVLRARGCFMRPCIGVGWRAYGRERSLLLPPGSALRISSVGGVGGRLPVVEFCDPCMPLDVDVGQEAALWMASGFVLCNGFARVPDVAGGRELIRRAAERGNAAAALLHGCALTPGKG